MIILLLEYRKIVYRKRNSTLPAQFIRNFINFDKTLSVLIRDIPKL